MSPYGKYYRDVSGRRGRICPFPKSFVWAEVLDAQMDIILTGLSMPPSWQIEVLDIVTSLDEWVWVARERERVEEKLKRLRELYAGLDMGEAECELENKRLEVALCRPS